LKLDKFVVGKAKVDNILVEFQKLVSGGAAGFIYLPDLESDGILPADFYHEIEDMNLLIEYL